MPWRGSPNWGVIMRAYLLLALCCLSVAVFDAAAADNSAVRVFVTSAGAINGFTDPNKENQDTVKDLLGSLKGRRAIAITDKRDEAEIVLVVMSRDKPPSAWIARERFA